LKSKAVAEKNRENILGGLLFCPTGSKTSGIWIDDARVAEQ